MDPMNNLVIMFSFDWALFPDSLISLQHRTKIFTLGRVCERYINKDQRGKNRSSGVHKSHIHESVPLTSVKLVPFFHSNLSIYHMQVGRIFSENRVQPLCAHRRRDYVRFVISRSTSPSGKLNCSFIHFHPDVDNNSFRDFHIANKERST